jgi:tetratricopeptide (TPR) repeat protein/peptidoglycan/xylan/chitin deacetylase (PgdA/CDA1 family)
MSTNDQDTRNAPPPEKTKPLPSGWMRPVRVKQDNNFRAWMLFLAGVCLIAALWVPVRTAWQRARYKPVTVPVRDADSFVVLAYTGVSAGKVRGPEEISRAQFESHIRALHERGFNPIGIKDVVDFYTKGTPLPRRAVMITLEQAKKSSYIETRSILQEYRWQAVMMVRSDTIARRDQDVLRWPILRDMHRSATWDIAPQSISGFKRIPAGPNGETGNFFSSPMWLAGDARLETPVEFFARIKAEHQRTVDEFKQQIGSRPLAFAFPFGDYGQFDARAVATRVMNLGAISDFYDLGFALGPFMLNTRHSDPRALNRMQVKPDWTTEEFIAVIESSQTVRPCAIKDALAATRWQTVWGIGGATTNTPFELRSVNHTDKAAGPPGTGALTWLLGSDLFEDLLVNVRFRLRAGQFVLRFRYRLGNEEGIRFLLDPAGNRQVLQKLYGAEELLLANQHGNGISPDDIHELSIALNGRTMTIKLNGEMIMAEPITLMTEPAPGMFGFEVWDPRPGAAAVEILSLEFPPCRNTLMYWGPENENRTPSLISRLHQQTLKYAAISPPWMDLQRAVPLVLPEWDDQALTQFARIHNVPVMPRITLHSAELTLGLRPEQIITEAHRMGFGGIYLDCRNVPVSEIPLITPWLQTFHETTKERQMKLALTLPTAIKRMTAFASIAGLFPGALIAAPTQELATTLSAETPNVVVAEKIADPLADMHISLYHQLALRELPAEILAQRTQKDAKRTEGLLLFHEGKYEEAVAVWQSWLEEDDPRSADAMGLIGMAYIKLGEPEKALEYYTRSLDVAPGQISMAVRRAELLDSLDRTNESREQLNLYARIFPGHPEILIAQAKWLERRNRRTEARVMLEALVKDQPFNVGARVALLSMQDSSVERYRTMRDILALGKSPDSRLPFGNMLLSQELLTYPESGVFFEYIRERAASAQGSSVQRLYERFMPLTDKVVDNFAQGRLSDEWIASAGIRALERGSYELRTAIDQAEAYLRLHRSELMRDGYLDVILDETQGFFWVYARRSARTMVRFGFDNDGFIHIQAWHNGDLLASHTRPWMRPPGSLRMRLEIRGDGARGFVNEMEVFDTPLDIPRQVAYGWWGIAPFAFELGIARARIIQMECAPLPPTIVMTAPGNPEDQIVQLRPHAGNFSALAPAWIFQNPDGSLPMELPADASIMRMFCAFHGIRLLPVIDLAYDGAVQPQQVTNLIKRNNLAGVIIKRRTQPSRQWLDAMHAALEKHPATVLILQTEAALWNLPRAGLESRGEHLIRPEVRDNLLPSEDETLFLKELPVGSVLLSPVQTTWNVTISLPGNEPAHDQSMVHPRLLLLGREGWMQQQNESAPANAADTTPQS